MRAALGLALLAGGGALVLLILHGRTPFDATSASSGSAAQSGGSDPAHAGTITTAKAPSAGGLAPGFGGGFPQ